MISPSQETIDDYYHALGMLTVAHSEIEHWMKTFANLMINPWSKASEIMTSDLPAKPLREKLMCLYRNEESDTERIKAFEKLLERIDSLSTGRNNMLHSFWFFYPLVDGSSPVRLKGKASFKGFKNEPKPVAMAEILDLVNGIRQASLELQQAMFEWQTEHDSPRITISEEENRNDE